MKRILHSSNFAFLITAILCSPAELIALNKPETLLKQQNSKTGFIENKGQIIDQNNNSNPAVLYLLNMPGMNVQLRKCGFSYDLYRISNIDQRNLNFEQKQSIIPSQPSSIQHPASSIQFHRIDIDLLNANLHPTIETSAPSLGYLNYYTTGTPAEGVTGVRSFATVTYKNIYPGIDLQFAADNDRLFEYTFILRPGSDINSIKLKVYGPEKIKTFREGLRCETSLGDIDETIPVCYYGINDKRVPVKGRFKKIAEHLYGFAVDHVIPDGAFLVIDPVPTRRWGTYYGGGLMDDVEYNCCATDGSGNVIIAGTTQSANNIASAGAYQTTRGGTQDAFLVKFQPDGQRQWGTYYGGSGADEGLSCTVDHNNNIYLGGDSDSPTGIATPGAYQTVLQGGGDAMLIKFTPGGQRIWGTYYGGSNDESILSCSIDSSGFIYFAGITNSTDNIATAGVHQTTYGGGLQDGFLVKFTEDCQRVWGAYYGGSSLEQDITCSASRHTYVFITGTTISPNNIATPGSFMPFFNGQPKGFLAAFDSSGERLWGTYYAGETNDDDYGCAADTGNNVYIYGMTGSNTNIATPGAFQPSRIGGGGGYIAKFSAAGSRLWGTYYGTGNDRVNGGAVDDSGYLFICGIATSQNTIIASTGAYQTHFNGGIYDALLAKFDGGGQRIWGTYYGGTGQDEGHCCAVDHDNNVFMAGVTLSVNSTNNNRTLCTRVNAGNYIATPGSHQPEYAGVEDAFLVKFSDCTTPDTASQIQGPFALCQNSFGNVFYVDPIPAATDYHWCVTGNLTISSGQHTPSINVDVGGMLGPDTISVYGINSCDSGYSIQIVRWVYARPVANLVGTDTSCAGEVHTFTTAGGKSNYAWTVSPGGTIISGGTQNDSTCNASWTSTGAQWIEVNWNDAHACTSFNPAHHNVWVKPSPSVTIIISSSMNPVCQGTTVTYTALGINGGLLPVYQWQVNGTNAGTNSTIFTYPPLNADIVRCILTSSITGCLLDNPDTSITITMIVNPYLPVSISISPSVNPVCSGNPVFFTATTTNGGFSPAYLWKVNGINVGTSIPTYSYTPANGDIVKCILNSNVSCPTGNPASSNSILMTVNPVLPVGISISPSLNPICAGTSVTYTATPTNQGSIPVYQWKVNGINVGINSLTYSYLPLNGDIVSCTLTSNAPCASGNPASSNTVVMIVNPVLAVSVTVTASQNPSCSGTMITFTAHPTNEGSTPTYQWKVNGINVGSNSSTYSYIPSNGDLVSCTLTSSETCTTNNPASSIQYPVSVNPVQPVSVTITAVPPTVCSGSTMIFTAHPVNGGVTLSYQWKVNNANVGTNSDTYSFIPANGDLVSCILTSSEPCATNNPASSIQYPVSVSTSPIITFTACFDTITTVNAKPIKLKGGIPLGGTYSGPGVNSVTGYFNPALAGVGTKTITYSYTNAALCTAGKSISILDLPSSILPCGTNLTDPRDNHFYPTVQIGTQCWLSTNLNFGTILASSQDQRDNCIAEKYCYNDSPINCTNHGGLYQWDELMLFDQTPDAQGFCPPGWHIPSENDWNILFTNYISNAFAGSPLKYSGFSGFNALLSGTRHMNKGWDYFGFAAFFWSSTLRSDFKAWAHGMTEDDPSVSLYPASRANAFSVRCLKD